MFKEETPNKQLSVFSSVHQHLPGRSSNLLNDDTSWHKNFFREVVSRIDERIFSQLFSSSNGAPNASIRTLVGMMILKEGQGYNDKKLFEECRFNLITRSALGLENLDDVVPSESTYYQFRKRIYEYYLETGEDLFYQCFQSLTSQQILDFEVSGRNIRMDSKLISSNIAFCSRYELIFKSLIEFYKHSSTRDLTLLSEDDLRELQEYAEEDPSKTVYNGTKSQITERMKKLGRLIHKVLNAVGENENPHYKTLVRVFHEQYKVTDQKELEITPNKEISAKSIQSPYDPECHYRSKNQEQTKGYSHNITETATPENSVNLITDVQTEKATHPDNEYTREAVADTREVLQQEDEIENAHADGAYHSQANQSFMKFNDINFYLTGFQGPAPRYEIEQTSDEVEITDTKYGTKKEVTVTAKGKYRIKTGERSYRYFTKEDIDKCRKRKELEQIPKEIRNIRNNVEATIYQLAYPLRKDKTRYRGYFKNKMWAILRSTWINCVRITQNSGHTGLTKAENAIKSFYFLIILPLLKQFNIIKLSRINQYR